MPDIKKKKLTDSEIKAMVEKELQGSMGYQSSELATQRARAMDRYLGEPIGTEMEGRSQVHTRDVMEIIEWILPSLIKVFASTEKAVEFVPVGPEDEEKALQEGLYLNHVFYQENDGFLVLYSWFKDALLSKNGIIKVYAEDNEKTSRESYFDLLDPEFQALSSDEELELIEHSTETKMIKLDDSGQSIPVVLHDAKFMRTTSKVSYKVSVVPPEEFSISTDAQSIDASKARFCAHTTVMTVSDVRSMGYSDKDIQEMDFQPNPKELTLETISRKNLTDEYTVAEDISNISQQRIRMNECYMYVDRDGDGISELVKILYSKNFIDVDDIEYHPIIAISPVILTHKFFGLSIADFIGDIQEIRTHLFRSYMDNINQTINGTTYYDENRVNVDDMLSSTPFGIRAVDGSPGDAVFHVPPHGLPPDAFSLNDFLDKMINNRVGDFRTPLDPNVLATAQTGAMLSAINEARSKVEMIARIFGEVGVKQLFRTLHHLVRTYSNKEQVVKLRNKWVPVDPREWRERNNLVVRVGLGTQNKAENVANMNQLLQTQMGLIQAGIPILVPNNIYNTARELVEHMGYHAEHFFTSPDMIPPKPPQQDPNDKLIQAQIQIESGKLQVEREKAALAQNSKMSEMQLKAKEMEIKQSNEISKANLERLRAELERAKVFYDTQKKDVETTLKNKEINLDAEYKQVEQTLRAQEIATKNLLEEYKLELNAQIEILKISTKNDETSKNINELMAKFADIETKMDSGPESMDISYDDSGRITSLGNKKIKRDINGRPVKIETDRTRK